MSEGRSMLPSDYQLMVKPDSESGPSHLETRFKNIGAALNQDVLNRYTQSCRNPGMLSFQLVPIFADNVG